jgi:membrane-associated phospholipid phosphatase
MVYLGMGAFSLVVATYLFTTFTRLGQVLVDEVWLSRVIEGHRLLALSRDVLQLVDLTTVAAACVLLLIWAVRTDRSSTGAALVAGFVAAVLTTEALKFLLPRPHLAQQLEAMMGSHAANTFPSGHVTIVTAIVISVLTLTSAERRFMAALVGAGAVAAVSCAVVVAGWHRPSDVLGGLGWALTWQAPVLAWALATRGAPALQWRTPRMQLRRLIWGSGTLLIVCAVIVGTFTASATGTTEGFMQAWFFGSAMVLIAALAIATPTVIAWITRGVEIR